MGNNGKPIGALLLEQRRNVRLSQKALAQTLGVCRKTLHNWEKVERIHYAGQMLGNESQADRDVRRRLLAKGD